MPNIKVNRDSKLIKVLASQARRENVEPKSADEAAQIISELMEDLTPEKTEKFLKLLAV